MKMSICNYKRLDQLRLGEIVQFRIAKYVPATAFILTNTNMDSEKKDLGYRILHAYATAPVSWNEDQRFYIYKVNKVEHPSNFHCGYAGLSASCRDTSLSIGGQVTARCCHHSGSDSSGQVCFNSSTQMWAVSLNACDMTFCEGASLGVHVVCCHTTLTGEAIEHAKSRSKAKTTDVLHHAENGLLAALNVHCDTHMLTSC